MRKSVTFSLALISCSRASSSLTTNVPSSSTSYSHVTQSRLFSTHGRMSNEYDFGNKLADVPVLTGKTKPLTRDGGWTCSHALTERMVEVVPKLLTKHKFTETEIRREMNELFYQEAGSRNGAWVTVEDFQKTPWFRRFRPADSAACVMVSYECMKILEEELVPPSLRNDPYSALRKRHMEDQFMNERFSEVHAKSVRRDDLAKQTKGMGEYGAVSRKSFLEFEKKFNEARGPGISDYNDAYQAWLNTVSKDANFVGKN